MGADGGVSGFVHGGHAWTVLFGGEALDVCFQGNRSHCRTEVEESRLWGIEKEEVEEHGRGEGMPQ